VALNTPLSHSVEVKERAELYLYSLLWVFMTCSRTNFTFKISIPQTKDTPNLTTLA
jgi:hypothetical protein